MKSTSTYSEAEAIHQDILTRNPQGCTLSRPVFDRLLVRGYRKSLQAARRIIETGEVAGFWTRQLNQAGAPKGLTGWVEIHPLAVVVPVMPATR